MTDDTTTNDMLTAFNRNNRQKSHAGEILLVIFMILLVIVGGIAVYSMFRIEVGRGQVAVLIRKTGKDLPNSEEVAPSEDFKGVQRKMLTEGRYFYNPYEWKWKVVDQIEIGSGEMGIKVSLTGDDLGYGEFLAKIDPETGEADTKGIVPGVLNPGRYPIHPYLYYIEIQKPVTIPAGFKGVVTNLADPLASDPNRLLVKPGERGVQEKTLEPGTHYLNPYEYRIDLVDCRSQRFNLGEEGDMGFPTKDGFWVSLDGVIEFRVNPEKASEVYVMFNDIRNGPVIDEEIVQTVIMPNARSFCRLSGSNSSGREFIQGATRTAFQETFEKSMREACQPLGIEIIQALITRIRPPQQIADPVKQREIAKQQELQFKQQILQQESEQKLAIERALVDQKQAIVKADQEVVKITTLAKQEQQVAVTKANQELAVAKLKMEAAMDEAAAITSLGKAAADVIRFENEAESAGWKKAVEAFGGDGESYAQYTLYKKLSNSYRKIMANTADSPIMKIFEAFNQPKGSPENAAALPPAGP